MITINGIEIDAYVDFGNGLKFSVDEVQIEEVECYGISFIFKINPNSLKWFEIEYDLHNPMSLRGYEQFLAEQYEIEDENFKEIWEDLDLEIKF